MPTLLDLAFIALFAVILPLWDTRISWPAFRRRAQIDPVGAKLRLSKVSIATAWPMVAVGAAIWIVGDRSLVSLGLGLPQGWRWWVSVGLVALLVAYYVSAVATVAANAETRATLRQQMGGLTDLMPRTRTELRWFIGVSLTAGFCEEFLYRGFFIGVFAPWLGWWGAAALSLPFFALGHLPVYQGWHGVVRTGLVGALYTLIVWLFGSLWPAIALHVLLDVSSGIMAWLALREGEAESSLPA